MNKFLDAQSQIFPWQLHPLQLYGLAQEYGINSADLLAALGLEDSQLENLALNLSWQQYRSMVQLVENKGPSNWGFKLGQRLNVPSNGLLSLAVMNSESWRQAIGLLTDFKILVTSLFYLKPRETEKYLVIELHPEFTRDPLTQAFFETFFAIIYQLLLSVSNFQEAFINNTEQLCMGFQGEPPLYEQEMRAFFNNNILFNQGHNQIRINKCLADRKLTSGNPLSAHSIVAILSAQLALLPANKGFLHVVHELFEQGNYNQEKCAKKLNISVATLKRKLKTACTTFNYELANFRQVEACHLLNFEIHNIDLIADKLGFQDIGSFRRFFKKQMGVTPSEFRSMHLDGEE